VTASITCPTVARLWSDGAQSMSDIIQVARRLPTHIALTADADADIRWREWQARAAEGDRWSAATMGGLTVLVSIEVAFWLFVELV
jgi:hypothetical protein